MATQIEIPSLDQLADKGDLAKSHIPPGANSVVNGVALGTREVPVTQTVNGVTRQAGTVDIPVTGRVA